MACLQCKAKKTIEQRFDFPFDKRIETVDRLLTMHGQTFLKQRLDLPFYKRNETRDRLPAIKGQKIVERLGRFSI